ncbi:TerC family protein [Marisediminicola senii]|uniref:TerC family protein n=1 Tax=Marisediminicola senii TaxID=2711233 RepID=UPI0013EAA87F|nr:TerC family protein [Marisediminicola senii]
MELPTELPLAFEVVSIAVLVAILAVDLLLVIRRPHVPHIRELGLWVAFYVGLALVFAVLMYFVGGPEHAGQFVAGWLTEYALSVDNLFVFLVIMSRFSVPAKLQQEVLMIGIVIALVLRGIFILLGAQLIENFSWVFYLFGAFLLVTAFRQAFTSEESLDEQNTEESRNNVVVRFIMKRVPTTTEFHGSKIRTTVDGRRVFTPMLIVFLAIGSTDLLFALDSIPAIFGITTSAFIVFTANIFALMGLRQLYFLLGGLLDRLVYLHYGIAAILAFIGIKLVLQAMRDNQLGFINGGEPIEWVPEIGTVASLGVIVGAVAIATIASLIKSGRDERAVAADRDS